MLFQDQFHEEFYNESLNKAGKNDCYHKALFYCIGLDCSARENINRIYNFQEHSIKTDCIFQGWQTSGSLNVVRLAFQLFTGGFPTVEEFKDSQRQLEECGNYSVNQIFCSDYAHYFVEAVKIRYSAYF